ncbi:MAG TPA: glycosyltransferase family 1 protein [Vicinamibacterales bacterium]
MRPLRIGADARELLGARTGVGRYLGELMERWTSREDAANREFVLYAPEPLALDWPHTRMHVVPGGRGTWWEQTKLGAAIRADALDVFFAPAYTAPLRLDVPLAVTIHDVSFSRRPEWFRPRERHRRHLLTRSAARRARVIVTVSEFSKTEIAEVYAVPSSRIRVIHNGLTLRAGRSAAAREPMVLYAGSIFNRRRVPDLIAAFAKASETVPDARLVIAGDNRTWPFEDLGGIAAAQRVSERATIRNYVTDAELDDLYSRASVFAFLSEYEGFGFTPLEALGAGVPAVVADTPVAREIYGEAVTRVPVGDIDETARALVRLLTSPGARAAQLAAAPALLARYSWDRAAAETLSAIEGIAGR